MPLVPGPSRRKALACCVAAFLLGLPTLSACSSGGGDSARGGRSGESGRSEPLRPQVGPPDEATSVMPGGAVETAVATSAALYDRAPVVLLAGERDAAAQARAASVAVALGAPLLVAPGPAADPADAAGTADPADARDDEGDQGTAEDERVTAPDRAVTRELRRLDPRAVLTFGRPADRWAGTHDVPSPVRAPADPADLAQLAGDRVGDAEPVAPADLLGAVAGLERDDPPLLSLTPPSSSATAADDQDADDEDGEDEGSDGDAGALPDVAPADPLDSVLVLADPDDPATDVAAAATARASGARVRVVVGTDPRADHELIRDVSAHPPERVVALGDGFGPPERLAQRLAVAETGVELPGGGQVVFPGRRMAALYGHPGTPAMGVLGEQPVEPSITRAQGLAAQYDPLVDEPVVPAFELIATVASSAAGPDGDYSDESTVDDLRPWIDAAGRAGVYVVLDLQPGRTDFLTQARRYEELLTQPHVGLALDPEWRLGPNQRHLSQIGSVDVAEINRVVTWLADLTRDHQLPQKLLLVHQFRTAMITDRARMDTSRDELSVLIHADGFGTRGQKFSTWNALHVQPPPNITWGWKNFIDEDQPMFTPAETVAIDPSPRFVSYQ
jgi:hypothetical protein